MSTRAWISRRRLRDPSGLWLAVTVAAVVALVAVVGTVGADARWLAALGRLIVSRGSIPSGVPFAVAPTGHWPNVPVLGELIFHWLEAAAGDRGLMLAQLVAVGAACALLARDAKAAGATCLGTSRMLGLVALGSVTSLAVARAQLFSLVLFPAVCGLLRSESRRPSGRIWVVVAFLVLWSNLHGAVLVGLAAVLCYLVGERMRATPVTALAVGVAAIAALFLTPALGHTFDYYRGVLGNTAAARGEGMWSPLSLTDPVSVALIAAGCVLAFKFWRAQPPLWEWLVATGLAVLTVGAARSGVWLLFFLAPTAARSFQPVREWRALVPVVLLASTVAIVFGLLRGPVAAGASPQLVAQALSLAGRAPVMAEGGIDEQVALAGGRIVIGDPIDAFSVRDQNAYLDWLDGQRRGLVLLDRRVRVVMVMRGSNAQRLMSRAPGFSLAGSDRRVLLYARA